MQRHFIAFYCGHGNWADKIVRFVTRSSFSHCELFRSQVRPRPGETVTCLGASWRDGGVRLKDIALDPEKWRICEVAWA